MAYRIHHIEGVILEAQQSGDADITLVTYTRELGLVYISAKSLRRSGSRLRFVLQQYSRAKIDVVHAKRGWMLTSAQTIDTQSGLWAHAGGFGGRARVYAEAVVLLRRLVRGPESDPVLYGDFIAFGEYLARAEKEQVCRAIGLLFVIRTLALLGYWEQKDGDERYVGHDGWSRETLLSVIEQRALLARRIAKAMEATQL